MEAFKGRIVGKSTTKNHTTDPQGRKGQLEIIWQNSFRLLSLWYYLVFCWPLLRAQADSLTARRGAAAVLLFHLAFWEHKCLCLPTTLINLMQLILAVVTSLGSDSKKPTHGRHCGGFLCRPLWPPSAVWVRDGASDKMGVMGHADNTQTTCLQGHAGSSLPSFHIHVFTRATQHIWCEIWVMDLCLVQRFIPLYS